MNILHNIGKYLEDHIGSIWIGMAIGWFICESTHFGGM